jgi:hypothetical protein
MQRKRYNSSLKTLYGYTTIKLKHRLIKLVDLWDRKEDDYLLEEIGKSADMFLYRGGNPYSEEVFQFFVGYGYKPIDKVGLKQAEREFKDDKVIRNRRYNRKQWRSC